MKNNWKLPDLRPALQAVGAVLAGLWLLLQSVCAALAGLWRKLRKKYRKPALLPLAVLIAGAVGAVLRLWLLGSGKDSGGLIVPGHPAAILLVCLTLGVLVLLLCATRHLVQGSKYSFNFPASKLRFGGAMAGALGVLVTAISQFSAAGDGLSTACAVLGVIAALVLGYTGFLYLTGKQPSLFLHGFVCVYLMLMLICQYRIWSSEPQIQTYCYPLLATVCIMLACYHNAMFDGDWGTRRAFTVYHLLAGFFCCLSVVGDYMPLFYLGMGVWMFTDRCSLKPMSTSYLREHKR